MTTTFWFFARFLALFSVVSAMVIFNFVTWGFDEDRGSPVWRMSDAQPERGAQLIRTYGCSACHAISGFSDQPVVGPSLERMPDQLYVAGLMANTPENLMQWIQIPDQIRPNTAMPNLNVPEEDARDISAYLLNLRR